MPQGLSTAEDVQEKTKKKKWWGDLFRRRSKKVSESSSEGEEEEPAKRRGGFLRRKKHDRGSKDVTSSFLINPGLNVQDRGRSLDSVKSSSSSLSRKRVKAKVEASREQLARESSSDEGSSYTSSLPSGGSYPRRSRAARTERYNRRLWSASVVYQECSDYQETKFRAKAKSATPSPAASPKFRPRVTSDEWSPGAPRPPPRRMDSPKYQPPVYTAPINPRQPRKPCFNGLLHHASDPVLLPRSSLEEQEEERKPPAAPPRRVNSQEDRRRQANLEEALNELEAIYKKLEDLQETATPGNSDAEPRREDDMAYRRLNKREPSCQDVREIMSQAGSYLLVSPTLSPPPITPPSPTMPLSEPDVTLDDVVYRSINHLNNSLKCADPQPPFGIPVGPISPAPSSDYLHAEPSYEYKPPNQPDIVTDDLAYRNLRKDSHDLRKKKAVRSMSANLSNVILKNNNNAFTVNNNNRVENKSQSYSNIPEEMRLAQRILDIRRGKLLENKQQAYVPKVNKEELRKKFFDDTYNRKNESFLLKQLEDEARATSKEIDQKLSRTNATKNEALYSKSMTDLLDELTKNLDYDFGQSSSSCTTCGDKMDSRLAVLKKKRNNNCYQVETENRKPPFSLSFEERRINNARPQVRSKSVYSGGSQNNKVSRESWENLPRVRKKTESPRGWESGATNNPTLDELCYNLSSSPKSVRSSSLKIAESTRPYECYHTERSESYDCPSASPTALRRRTPTSSPTLLATRRLTPSPSYLQKSKGSSPRSWETNLEELCNFRIVRKESPRPWLTRQSPVDGELPTTTSSSLAGSRSMDDGHFFAGERRVPKPRWSSMRDAHLPEPVVSWRKGSPSPTSLTSKRSTDEPFPGMSKDRSNLNWQTFEDPKATNPPARHSMDPRRNPLKIDESHDSNSSPDSVRRSSVSPRLKAFPVHDRIQPPRSSPPFLVRRSSSRELQSPPPSTSSVRPSSSTSPIDVAAMEAESTLDEEKERQGVPFPKPATHVSSCE